MHVGTAQKCSDVVNAVINYVAILDVEEVSVLQNYGMHKRTRYREKFLEALENKTWTENYAFLNSWVVLTMNYEFM